MGRRINCLFWLSFYNQSKPFLSPDIESCFANIANYFKETNLITLTSKKKASFKTKPKTKYTDNPKNMKMIYLWGGDKKPLNFTS